MTNEEKKICDRLLFAANTILDCTIFNLNGPMENLQQAVCDYALANKICLQMSQKNCYLCEKYGTCLQYKTNAEEWEE